MAQTRKRTKRDGLRVGKVLPGSIAAELGIEPGDRLLAVNDKPVNDIIDYRFWAADDHLDILIAKRTGERWLCTVDAGAEPLGLQFTSPFGRVRRCQNRCLFCFIDQMPPGLRRSLYVKDDDYRLSFWEGNFITLTNLRQADLERIAEQRLSPLYVSVHTTDPELRAFMMGNRRAKLIMEQLDYLRATGIKIHAQIVLCPGLNDGPALERTVRDLASLWPAVQSIAIVPVGLTRFYTGLRPLRAPDKTEMRRLVEQVTVWQNSFKGLYGTPLVYAGDECYLLGGLPVPARELYGDFPQLENGVGLVRLFLDEWQNIALNLPCKVPSRRITLITGELAAPLINEMANRLHQVKGLFLEVAVIKNNFFGGTITAAGLLTGADILAQIGPTAYTDLIVMPSQAVKNGQVLLDGFTVEQLARSLKTPIALARGPAELVEIIVNT